jgi:hypothetical protein
MPAATRRAECEARRRRLLLRNTRNSTLKRAPAKTAFELGTILSGNHLVVGCIDPETAVQAPCGGRATDFPFQQRAHGKQG